MGKKADGEGVVVAELLNSVVDQRAGLTFLELLLAVAIASLVMVAAGRLMFSFAHFWQQSEVEPRFAHHVEGVVSFLQHGLDQSENLSGDAVSRYGWSIPPKAQKPAIHFRQASADPFFVTELVPEPPLDAWIVFDEEKGLHLVWHVPQSLTKGKLELHHTPVSQWVEDLEIGYFKPGENVWEYESCSGEGLDEKSRVPQALRIIFNKDGRREIRHIRMRRHDRHVLVY